jgi:putative transposase
MERPCSSHATGTVARVLYTGRMIKSYKYRLYPTTTQRTALNTMLDACRWAYNKTLEVRKQAWEERRESVSLYDTIKMLPGWKTEHEWMRQANAEALQNACVRVDLAFQAFFRRVKAGETPGYPRFRGRHRYDSFTYPRQRGNWGILDNGRVRLSKIGEVKIKLHRPLEGEAKTLTVSRDRLGNWYACFVVEVEDKPLAPSPYVTGIDLGLTTFATLSHGKPIDNPRFFRQDEKALAKAQRKASRFAKGTPERRKAMRAVQHIHKRIANRRNNFAHQTSRALVNRYQVICFEDLSPANMVQNHSLAKSISDAAWSQLVHYTTYKAADAGRACVLVDPRYTSQDCSGCGERVKKDLAVRIHDCPHCGLTLDRDLNAALNILARGLASLGATP